MEAHLASLPGVRDAAVLVHEDPVRGPVLVGYAATGGAATGWAGDETAGADGTGGSGGSGGADGDWEGKGDGGAALRARLAERLPTAMVPAAVVVLDRLPLTPNRKIDRRALHAHGERLGVLSGARFGALGGSAATAEPPRTALERTLAGLFAETLGLPGLPGQAAVGRNDDFFALGGHSILATRLAARIRAAFDVPLALRHLFERPTVAGLAAILADAGARSGSAEKPIPRLPRPPGFDDGARGEGRTAPDLDPAAGFEVPLSPGQRRLWFLDRLEPESTAYTMAGALALHGALDGAALAGALADVVRRHEVLRTVFPARDGRPLQVVRPPSAVSATGSEAPLLPVVDLSGLAAGPGGLDGPGGPDGLEKGARERWRARVLEAAVGRPFDLARGPLVRALLARTAPDEHALLVTMHHIVSDGWSVGLFVREMAGRYAARRVDVAPSDVFRSCRSSTATMPPGWRAGRTTGRSPATWPTGGSGWPACRCSSCPPTGRGRSIGAAAGRWRGRRSPRRPSPRSTGWPGAPGRPVTWC